MKTSMCLKTGIASVLVLFLAPALSFAGELSAKEVCSAHFEKLGGVMKLTLGEDGDAQLAPSIDDFMTGYIQNYESTPAKSDYKGKISYAQMIKENKARDLKRLKDAELKLKSLERMAKLQNNDVDALDYAACLKSHVSREIDGLAEYSNYDLGKDVVLKKLGVSPSPATPAHTVSAAY